MRCALSPCPNDTYIFHAWIHGHVGQDLPISVTFADIQNLNEAALRSSYPLIKLSMSCFSKVIHNYQLLPVGAALGFNCGPKIIAKEAFPLSELSYKKMAIPGRETTAHLLLSRLGLVPQEKLFCPYNEIAAAIEENQADCGLIIHESRFTFHKQGFIEIADLGEMWHQKTELPLPLGGLAVSRYTPTALKQKIISTLQESLSFAKKHPQESLPFILSNAQDKEPHVVQQHIATYVNEETACLSNKGIEAIVALIGTELPQDWLCLRS